MNLQQLRAVRETVRHGFSLTQAAEVLRTTQPSVGRQIRGLEDDLGIDLFTRWGGRLTGLTPHGMAVLPFIEQLLLIEDQLRITVDDIAVKGNRELKVAATQSLAQYALPPALFAFKASYPGVVVKLHQNSAHEVGQMLLHGEADVGIATEAIAQFDNLVVLPCDTWTHTVIVPPGHPLDDGQPLTLQRLATFPLITYEPGCCGRGHIDQAFRRAGILADVVLSATDAEVIKTYTRLGMGVGIVASLAFDASHDAPLKQLDASHLFAINVTHLAIRRGAPLRPHVYDFICTFASSLTREIVEHALSRPAETVDDNPRVLFTGEWAIDGALQGVQNPPAI